MILSPSPSHPIPLGTPRGVSRDSITNTTIPHPEPPCLSACQPVSSASRSSGCVFARSTYSPSVATIGCLARGCRPTIGSRVWGAACLGGFDAPDNRSRTGLRNCFISRSRSLCLGTYLEGNLQVPRQLTRNLPHRVLQTHTTLHLNHGKVTTSN